MNLQEYLLTCLSEECSEVQLAISKANRFGLLDGYPGTNRTNQGDLIKEFNDLLGVIEVLKETGILNIIADRKLIDLKKDKVKEFMIYSIKRGTLQIDENKFIISSVENILNEIGKH